MSSRAVDRSWYDREEGATGGAFLRGAFAEKEAKLKARMQTLKVTSQVGGGRVSAHAKQKNLDNDRWEQAVTAHAGIRPKGQVAELNPSTEESERISVLVKHVQPAFIEEK
jgi:hypothetical protein